MVFVWPIVTSVVLTGLARDEILEPQIKRFVVVAGLGHFNCDVGPV